MLSLPTRIAGFIDKLRQAITARAACNPALKPMLGLVLAYLARTSGRLLALHDKWQRGILKPPRPRKPRPTPPANQGPLPAPALRTCPRLPRRYGWLVRDEPVLNSYATALALQLDQPDLRDFLAAVPRAGRLLRPLLHMLGRPATGTVLALPPRPKPIRRPKPPPEPRREGKYPRFNYDTYSPGKIPPFRSPKTA
jgi:hypothetical protein